MHDAADTPATHELEGSEEDAPLFRDAAAAYAWLDGRIDYERHPAQMVHTDAAMALGPFRARLAALGDPQLARRTIHIAGTRGKGTAALALEALLIASGQTVATFTSPHLREYRERIRIGGAPLAGDVFARLLGQIAQAEANREARAATENIDGDGSFKTVFETLTALYFLAAREAQVDWAVVETGLGGRLDATNVVAPGPVLWTRIGLEHTRVLGDTLTAIAGEKAAILKPGGWAVMGAQSEDGEARGVFELRAEACAASCVEAALECPVTSLDASAAGLNISFKFEGEPLTVRTGLFGLFQAENLQNALAMISELRRRGEIPRVSREGLVMALEALRLPGRLERVRLGPDLFADGAHCPTGARALAYSMAAHFGGEPAGLIVGMMDDKDHTGFFDGLARWPGWKWVICFAPPSPRAATSAKLAAAASVLGCPIFQTPTITDALESPTARAEKDLRVVVAGSLYHIAMVEDWGAGHVGTERKEQGSPEADAHSGDRHP